MGILPRPQKLVRKVNRYFWRIPSLFRPCRILLDCIFLSLGRLRSDQGVVLLLLCRHIQPDFFRLEHNAELINLYLRVFDMLLLRKHVPLHALHGSKIKGSRIFQASFNSNWTVTNDRRSYSREASYNAGLLITKRSDLRCIHTDSNKIRLIGDINKRKRPSLLKRPSTRGFPSRKFNMYRVEQKILSKST